MSTDAPKPKRKSSKSPTARSLEFCRKRNMVAQVVERWNQHARKRIDLFGVVDIVVLDVPNGRTIGIQSTSRNGGNFAARVHKIEAEPRVRDWLACGNRLIVHGWGKMASGRWELRAVEVYIDSGALMTRELE